MTALGSDEVRQGGQGGQDQHGSQGGDMRTMYLRFAAMILTAMVVMYAVMYVGTWEWAHVTFSESRVFMALTMGGAMGLVMIAWMLTMYRSLKGNIAWSRRALSCSPAASISTAARRPSTTAAG